MEYHGDAKRGQLTPLYNTWRGMKARCSQPTHNHYKDYGGKGVKVCDEWVDSFINFKEWALDNGYKEGLSIDRIDVDGDYEPSNCKWSTPKEQANNKTTNHRLTYNGETKTINEWADYFGVKREIIKDRLRLGWTVDEIFETPVAKCERRDYEFNGETHNLHEWATIMEMSYNILHQRVRRQGWSIDKALTTPIRHKKQND